MTEPATDRDAWWAFAEQLVLIVLIGCALTAWVILVAINRAADDDSHFDVITMIAGGYIPHAGECFECFQPKLYHATAAVLTRLFFISTATGATAERILAQVLSAAGGAATLWAGWRMLVEAQFSSRVRLLAFALLACNAVLIADAVQVKNNTFVDGFSALAILLLLRLVRTAPDAPLDRRTVVFLALACIGASLSKGSGIVVTCAIGLLLAWRVVLEPRRSPLLRTDAISLAIFLAAYLATVPLLGQYAQTARIYGSPFALNVPKNAPPGLFTPVYPDTKGALNRPGVLSVVDGYLTLKPFAILERPWVGGQAADLSAARTSLWTQVFARSHFIFFEQWPLTWYNTDPPVVLLGRGILTAGWLTTGLMLIGFGFAVRDAIVRRRVVWPPLWSVEGAVLVVTTAMVAAFALFNATYRDSASMKATYMYPVLLCAVWAFARGVSGLEARVRSANGAREFAAFAGLSVVVVCALYVGQLVVLIQTIVATWPHP